MIPRPTSGFHNQCSITYKLILIIGIATISSYGLCESEFETERGNREPAVLGPAILEEEPSVMDVQTESDTSLVPDGFNDTISEPS